MCKTRPCRYVKHLDFNYKCFECEELKSLIDWIYRLYHNSCVYRNNSWVYQNNPCVYRNNSCVYRNDSCIYCVSILIYYIQSRLTIVKRISRIIFIKIKSRSITIISEFLKLKCLYNVYNIFIIHKKSAFFLKKNAKAI